MHEFMQYVRQNNIFLLSCYLNQHVKL